MSNHPPIELVPTLVSNSEFLAELLKAAPRGTTVWVNAFIGNPNSEQASWSGKAYNPALHAAEVDVWGRQNTYFSVGALGFVDGQRHRRKDNFERLLALVADDVDPDDLMATPSWGIETSPGKRQIGILLDTQDPDCANLELVSALVTQMADRGLIKADRSGNNAVRYVRLPIGQNQKPRDSGPFNHIVEYWNPAIRYTLEDAAGCFGVDLDEVRESLRNPSPLQLSTPSIFSSEQDERLRILTANIIRGENLHDSINIIAASMVACGAKGGAIVNLLRGLMDASLAARDDRWRARYEDIPRAVSTAEGKFTGTSSKVTITRADVGLDGCFVDLREEIGPEAEHPHFIEKLVPMGEVTLLAGHGAAGKSYIALLMLIHVALGRPFGPLATTRERVLFFSAEDDKKELQRRVAKICRALQIDKTDLADWLFLVDVSDLDPTLFRVTPRGEPGWLPMLDSLANFVTENRIGVTVIDNASDTFDGNEIVRNQVSTFIRSLRTRLARPDKSVILLAHTQKAAIQYSKSTKEDYSGSTAWHNSVRSRLSLEVDNNGIRILSHLKANKGPLAEPLQLEWYDGAPMLCGPYPGFGAELAGSLLRQAQRQEDDARKDTLVGIIKDFDQRGDRVPVAATGPYSAHRTLQSEKAFPRKMTSDMTIRLLRELERENRIFRVTRRARGKDVTCFTCLAAGSSPMPDEEGVATVTDDTEAKQ